MSYSSSCQHFNSQLLNYLLLCLIKSKPLQSSCLPGVFPLLVTKTYSLVFSSIMTSQLSVTIKFIITNFASVYLLCFLCNLVLTLTLTLILILTQTILFICLRNHNFYLKRILPICMQITHNFYLLVIFKINNLI